MGFFKELLAEPEKKPAKAGDWVCSARGSIDDITEFLNWLRDQDEAKALEAKVVVVSSSVNGGGAYYYVWYRK